MAFHPNSQLRLLENDFDVMGSLRSGIAPSVPWESIIDFATHESFCGLVLYPRQQTLLRLIFLETEQMTDYDLEVIESWRVGFQRARDVFGVQPDIWERVKYLKARGYRSFPHLQMVLGRRASKGFTGAIVGAERLAYLISLDNPQAHFGIRDGKDCFGNVGATSQTQAQRHQFADIRDVVENCRWLQPYIAESKDHQMRLRSPADLRQIARMKMEDVPVEHSIASLWVVALSASSVAGRGATSFFNYFDEFAFHVQGSGSSKTGENIYEDWQPSLGQFKQDALTVIPSSPFNKTGKFYELYQQGRVLMNSYRDDAGVSDDAESELQRMASLTGGDKLELSAEPGMLIFQGPSWAVYEDWERGPELVGVRFTAAPEDDLSSEEQLRRKLRNPDKFKVEREGQFAEVTGQYLDPDKVDAIFDPVPWRSPSILEPTPFGRVDQSYRIHIDPSKVGANFALAIAHTEMAPPDEFGDSWPHVIVDRLKVWRPRDFPINPDTGKHELDYLQIERELDEILYTFPSTSKFSADQFNSTGLLQRLKRKYSPKIRVVEETATEKSNYERAEKFKSAVSLGWVHSFRDTLYDDGGSLLELECKFLSEHNGRVVKQDIGPVQTKDLYDAVSVVVTDLLHAALERWGSDRLTAGAYGSSNVSGLKSGRELARAGGNIYREGKGSPAQKRTRAAVGDTQIERMRGRRAPDGQLSRSRSRPSERGYGGPTWR